MITADDIIAARPCSDWPPDRVRETIPEPISVTDLLRREDIPAGDRIWVGLAVGGLSERVRRLWHCDYAERALAMHGDPVDPRSTEAIAVARRYAVGDASDEELLAACAAGWAAALATDSAAACAAAWASACAAGWAAAWVSSSAAGCATEEDWQARQLARLIEREVAA